MAAGGPRPRAPEAIAARAREWAAASARNLARRLRRKARESADKTYAEIGTRLNHLRASLRTHQMLSQRNGCHDHNLGAAMVRAEASGLLSEAERQDAKTNKHLGNLARHAPFPHASTHKEEMADSSAAFHDADAAAGGPRQPAPRPQPRQAAQVYDMDGDDLGMYTWELGLAYHIPTPAVVEEEEDSQSFASCRSEADPDEGMSEPTGVRICAAAITRAVQQAMEADSSGEDHPNDMDRSDEQSSDLDFAGESAAADCTSSDSDHEADMMSQAFQLFWGADPSLLEQLIEGNVIIVSDRLKALGLSPDRIEFLVGQTCERLLELERAKLRSQL